jgi:hypothetical protein
MIFLDFRGKEMLQLCPRKILLNHPLYKLTDHQLMTNMSDYQRLMIGAVEQDDWMVAPEVMVEVGKRKFRKPQINNQKAEVFSLGIVCLYMATLIHPKEFKLYDFDRYIVDSEQLDQYIQLFTRMTIYSSTISNMQYRSVQSLHLAVSQNGSECTMQFQRGARKVN